MEPGGQASGLPQGARVFLGATIVAGAVALLAAVFSLPRGGDPIEVMVTLGGITLATSAMFFLQTRSMTLPWQGERLAIHADEAVLVISLFFLSPGAAVVAATGSTLLSQAFLRKPLIKAGFNASAVAVSAGVTALAWGALAAADVPAVLYAPAIPFVFTGLNQAIVAVLLSLVRERPLRTAFHGQLAKSILIAGSTGLILGGLAIFLLQLHWAALGIVVLLAFVFQRAMAAEYRHESELAARRALNHAMQRLAGTRDEAVVISAVYDACCQAFSLRGFEVTLAYPDRPSRCWTMSAGIPSKEPVSFVRSPLVTATGENIGELVLTVNAASITRLKEDEELASVFAGYLAAAAGNLRADEEAARQRELVSRNERLSMLGTLVSGVAHEINNPLMFMEGHLEMCILDLKAIEETDAKLPFDVPELRKGLETVLLGARRIEFISKGLRVVGRATPAKHEPVMLNDVVENVAKGVRLEPGVRIVLKLDPASPTILGDPAELREATLHLVRNAVDATAPRGGEVRITTTARADGVEISVEDDGPGIFGETREKLFAPFYTTKPDGVGLGLPIAHSLVRAHKGEIVVEAAPSGGARFRLKFPLGAAPLPRAG